MMSWQYLIANRRLPNTSAFDDNGDPLPIPEIAELVTDLNTAGQANWELVAVLRVGEQVLGFFKRPGP